MEENNGFLQIDKFSQLTRTFSNQKKAIVYFFLRLFKPNIASCENQSFQLGLFEGKTGSFDFFINLTNLELGLQPTIRKKWPVGRTNVEQRNEINPIQKFNPTTARCTLITCST